MARLGRTVGSALLACALMAASCSGPKTGEPGSTDPDATREASDEGADLERPDDGPGGTELERPDDGSEGTELERPDDGSEGTELERPGEQADVDLGRPTAPAGRTPDPADVYGATYRVTEGPRLDGMFVEFTARHGGGCEDHVFTLKPGPRSAEQPTVQPVMAHHDPLGDRCRAMVSTEVRLPLEPVLGADCTKRIELRAWPVDDATHRWVLDLKHPMGCE